MARKQKRFVEVHSEGAMFNVKIMVDRQTRVQYMHVAAGYAGGLTVLVDRDGKPLLYNGNFED